MSANAVAQLVSVNLYQRRFFPYYAFCMVAGLDEEGTVCVIDLLRIFLFFFFIFCDETCVQWDFVIFKVVCIELGRGAVYGYDAVGSFKRDDYGAMGSGQNFVVPLLDNLVSDVCHCVCELWYICYLYLCNQYGQLKESNELSCLC